MRSQRVQRFAYTRPAIAPGKTRGAARLVKTDILFATMQVFTEGAETVRHSHTGMDGFWLVLGGRALLRKRSTATRADERSDLS